ncbi:sulfotransferase family protein [Litorimonas sp. WD9-15]|uniref:sulfotransferase family protein n=1 Tax=Litorimonas sp. WD9-15 TaxID=3418716 RepID=UPI003D079BBB
MSDKDYIFLFSSDRSGSNLLLRLLGAHSETVAPPTSQLLPNLYKAVDKYAPLASQKNWEFLLKNAQNLHHAGFGEWTNYADLHSILSHQTERSVSVILRTIFDTEARAKNANVVAIKAHRAFEYADMLQADFPKARFIHLTRDPRDMALSWLNTPALRGGVARAAAIWKEEQAELLKLSKMMDRDVYRVRYEDILSQPKQVLKELCKALGVAFEDGMLNFYKKTDTQNIAGHVHAWNNLAKPLMSQNQAKYKSDLTLEQRAHIEFTCGQEMEQLGYAPDLNLKNFNLASIAFDLQENAPWEKPGYAKLSQTERDSHVVLRKAVKTLLEGPNY